MRSALRTRPLPPNYTRAFSSSSSSSSSTVLYPPRPYISRSRRKLQHHSFLVWARSLSYQLSRQNFGFSKVPSHQSHQTTRRFTNTVTTLAAATATTSTDSSITSANFSSPKYRGVAKIVEVGVRDGLQNEKGIVPTSVKIELLERLSSSGLTHIEAGSFVSPKWVPQMADTREIMKHLRANPPQASQAVTYSYLTPNERGLADFIAHSTSFASASSTAPPRQAHDSEIAIFGSASEAFSQKNINCSIAESLERFRPVATKALDQGIRVRGYVSMVIECPYDGPTPHKKVAEIVEGLLDMGCYEVSLGDTNGVGTPGTIGALVNYLIKERGIPAEKLAGHFHDTYGQAIANCLVALEAGIRTFDSSVAGLGGCPYSKGATGNVATEDLVYCLEGTGVKTGVDLQKIVEAGDWISKELGRKNESKVGTALMARRRSDFSASSGKV